MAETPAPAPSYYPVSLDVSGRPCLVVGGGVVAARKARGLLACGARVTVIAPSVGDDMESLAPTLAALERRPYRQGDASSFRLVVTATGIGEVDGTVHADAEAMGVWVNSADDRAHSSFILPAVHRDGAVTVAVSTGGLSPALASWLRARMAARDLRGVGALAQLLGEARARILQAGLPSDAVDWTALLDGPLPDLVEAGELDNARAIVAAATAN
jgi:uroporphyrin-III C-methyltransferase/precorrin-2 dehydrogenase/sirohydrochlorin ferrochelatase